jgi:negative regulator of sigma-B (phosphoserine phosphatase)
MTIPTPHQRAVIEWGCAGRGLEEQSGDLRVVVQFAGGALVALLDGLGHGPDAAAAAQAAVPVLEAYACESVLTLVQRCHEALRKTRGVAMSLASFNVLDSSMTWTGVGNVDSVLFRLKGARTRPDKAMLTRGGIVGYRLPPLRVDHFVVSPGDTLVMATDGIRRGFADGVTLEYSPQEIAESILLRYIKGIRRCSRCRCPLSGSRVMSEPLNALAREYVAGLGAYLEQAGESELTCAYELGRRAIAAGFGILEMAILHRAALSALVLSAPVSDQARCTDAAAAFFNELVAPFELALRGYRTANEALQGANERLGQQTAELAAALVEMEGVVHAVAHHLRSPLRAMEGYSHLLMSEYGGELPDPVSQFSEAIHSNSQRMARLVDDLLSFINLRLLPLCPTCIDIAAAAREVLDELIAAEPGRPVEAHVEELPACHADPVLLRRLLVELLSNALKFARDRQLAIITVGSRLGAERTDPPIYLVRDNGIGFDSRYADKLFKLFSQLNLPEAYEGTGAGLAIALRIVERMGGRIWAESSAEGGATFFFTLPSSP